MFIAYEVSLDVIKSLRIVMPQIERNDRDLADQIKRAASSVALNLAEGQRLTKGSRVALSLATQGSHGSGRAGLPHPARQRTGFATRRRTRGIGSG